MKKIKKTILVCMLCSFSSMSMALSGEALIIRAGGIIIDPTKLVKIIAEIAKDLAIQEELVTLIESGMDQVGQMTNQKVDGKNNQAANIITRIGKSYEEIQNIQQIQKMKTPANSCRDLSVSAEAACATTSEHNYIKKRGIERHAKNGIKKRAGGGMVVDKGVKQSTIDELAKKSIEKIKKLSSNPEGQLREKDMPYYPYGVIEFPEGSETLSAAELESAEDFITIISPDSDESSSSKDPEADQLMITQKVKAARQSIAGGVLDTIISQRKAQDDGDPSSLEVMASTAEIFFNEDMKSAMILGEGITESDLKTQSVSNTKKTSGKASRTQTRKKSPQTSAERTRKAFFQKAFNLRIELNGYNNDLNKELMMATLLLERMENN